MSGTPSNPVRITWHTTPPSPAQAEAWRWLWTRLLGHIDPDPEKLQPQSPCSEAATVATVGSGQPLWSAYSNDTRVVLHSKH